MRPGAMFRTFAILLLLSTGVSVVFLWGPEYMLRWVGHSTGDAPMLDKYRSTLVTIVGCFVVLATLFFVNLRTVDLTADNLQVTYLRLWAERYAKAVELLGANGKDDKPRLETRVGALFALERLAEESVPYRETVVKTIAAYIRTRCPRSAELTETSPGTRLDGDINEALAILSRLHLKPAANGSPGVDLSFCALAGMRLPGARFEGFNFRESDLRHSQLPLSVLCRADFRDAVLKNADITECDLTEAKLDGVDFSDAVVSGVNFTGASMSRTRFDKAYANQEDSASSILSKSGEANE